MITRTVAVVVQAHGASDARQAVTSLVVCLRVCIPCLPDVQVVNNGRDVKTDSNGNAAFNCLVSDAHTRMDQEYKLVVSALSAAASMTPASSRRIRFAYVHGRRVTAPRLGPRLPSSAALCRDPKRVLVSLWLRRGADGSAYRSRTSCRRSGTWNGGRWCLSPAVTWVRSRLVGRWCAGRRYKDEGGLEKTLEVSYRLVDHNGKLVNMKPADITTTLLYEDETEVCGPVWSCMVLCGRGCVCMHTCLCSGVRGSVGGSMQKCVAVCCAWMWTWTWMWICVTLALALCESISSCA